MDIECHTTTTGEDLNTPKVRNTEEGKKLINFSSDTFSSFFFSK